MVENDLITGNAGMSLCAAKVCNVWSQGQQTSENVGQGEKCRQWGEVFNSLVALSKRKEKQGTRKTFRKY